MRTKLFLNSLQANFSPPSEARGAEDFLNKRKHWQWTPASICSHMYYSFTSLFFSFKVIKTSLLLEGLQENIVGKFFWGTTRSWGEPAPFRSSIGTILCRAARSVTLTVNLSLPGPSQHECHVEMHFSLFKGLKLTLCPWGAGSPDWCPAWLTRPNFFSKSQAVLPVSATKSGRS